MTKSSLISTLPIEWNILLSPIIQSVSFQALLAFLENTTQTFYPPINEVFTAYCACSVSKIKVVIIGQDPYHGKNQAHGLSFSVKEGNKLPPSLRNIYKEMDSDLTLNAPSPTHGDLTAWANQGVFMINSVLTVFDGQPNSHQNKGWEEFTDATIRLISEQKEHVVFVLWGKFAQKKIDLIDSQKHLIIESPHPSPFSAHKGFFGSRPFSKINSFLAQKNQSTINWRAL